MLKTDLDIDTFSWLLDKLLFQEKELLRRLSIESPIFYDSLMTKAVIVT